MNYIKIIFKGYSFFIWFFIVNCFWWREEELCKMMVNIFNIFKIIIKYDLIIINKGVYSFRSIFISFLKIIISVNLFNIVLMYYNFRRCCFYLVDFVFYFLY